METGTGKKAADWTPFRWVSEHDAGQHQDRDRRHLPPRQPEARPDLPDQLRLPVQPPSPARQHRRAARLGGDADRAAALPARHRGCVRRLIRSLNVVDVGRVVRVGTVEVPERPLRDRQRHAGLASLVVPGRDALWPTCRVRGLAGFRPVRRGNEAAVVVVDPQYVGVRLAYPVRHLVDVVGTVLRQALLELVRHRAELGVDDVPGPDPALLEGADIALGRDPGVLAGGVRLPAEADDQITGAALREDAADLRVLGVELAGVALGPVARVVVGQQGEADHAGRRGADHLLPPRAREKALEPRPGPVVGEGHPHVQRPLPHGGKARFRARLPGAAGPGQAGSVAAEGVARDAERSEKGERRQGAAPRATVGHGPCFPNVLADGEAGADLLASGKKTRAAAAYSAGSRSPHVRGRLATAFRGPEAETRTTTRPFTKACCQDPLSVGQPVRKLTTRTLQTAG